MDPGVPASTIPIWRISLRPRRRAVPSPTLGRATLRRPGRPRAVARRPTSAATMPSRRGGRAHPAPRGGGGAACDYASLSAPAHRSGGRPENGGPFGAAGAFDLAAPTADLRRSPRCSPRCAPQAIPKWRLRREWVCVWELACHLPAPRPNPFPPPPPPAACSAASMRWARPPRPHCGAIGTGWVHGIASQHVRDA